MKARHERVIAGDYLSHHMPTDNEIKAGLVAMKKWKKASDWERSHLVDDIVLGKVLLGMHVSKVIAIIGEPDDPMSVKYQPGIKFIGYYFAPPDSYAALKISLDEDDRVESTILDLQ